MLQLVKILLSPHSILLWMQYQVVKKLRNDVLVLRGEIDALQRMQQENSLPPKLETQQSM